MIDMRLELRGGRHLWINSDGSVCVQVGLTSEYIGFDNAFLGWLFFPITMIEALVRLVVGFH